jgi:acyl-CoA synthetase (NDP forming)
MADDTSCRSALDIALAPSSIAVIGASDNPNKIGGRPLLYLQRFGFKGKVYPINPKRAETQGFKTYPSLAGLPEAPEAALIIVAGDAAIDAVDQCAAAGVKLAVVMASGFGETGAEGREKERRMVERAHEAGMRLVGPNSQGLANFGSGAVLSFSTMFIEAPPADGPVGIVSQSGAMSVLPYGLLRQKGIGVRHTHATGNDADITVAELAAAVAADPGVELLLLYLESIPDPEHLEAMAEIARARDLPVVALKSGRTAAGQSAARSHTGALANEDRVVDAFFARHGIWRARDMGNLVHAAELYLKGWRPEGRRLVAISNSGAVCVMAADAATECGMPLATFRPETVDGLKTILPSFATTTNPVDITAALLQNSHLFSEILPVIAKDPAADAFLIGLPVAGTGYDVDAFARDSAAVAAGTGKPLVVAAPQPSIAARFRQEGIPVFAIEAEAVDALNQLAAHWALIRQAKARRRPGERPLPGAIPARLAAADAPQPPVMLNEAESLDLLARAGLSMMVYRLCRDAEEAVAAFRALGRPVVLKGCSAGIAHKSELGLVALGVMDEAAVRDGFAAMAKRIRAADAPFDGVIVAAMEKGRRELMIGAHRDPVFGPVVVVGDGGKYVEALNDVRLLIPPFTADEVREALGRLHIAPLLTGVRGEPPMDVAAFCDAAVKVGTLMTAPDNRIVSLDLNPVLLRSEGEGYRVLDAVVFATQKETIGSASRPACRE